MTVSEFETSAASSARLRRLAKAFHALHAPLRLRIVAALAQGEINVLELSLRLRVSQPLLSWHLKELRQAGFVAARRAGREMQYSLHREGFAIMLRDLAALLGELRTDDTLT